MTTGIILTAGKAERLDNKILLPIKEGCMFESALQFLRKCDVENIVIVQDKRRLVESYWKIRQEYYDGFCAPVQFVVQPEAEGVCDAITRAACLVDDWGIVTFGDNWYGKWDPSKLKFDDEFCTVVRHKNSHEDLDRYQPANHKTPWATRDKGTRHDEYLAGLIHLRRRTMEEACGSLCSFLNTKGIKGRNVPQTMNDSWMDLGSVEYYQTYLRMWEIHEA